jgi:hypothetical protein
MKRQRTPQPQDFGTREVRASSGGGDDEMRAVAHDHPQDEFDGQLGPDELPSASEVVMNHEAKRHRG